MTSSINRRALGLLPLVLLSGCNMVVMNASGDIARQQGQLVVASTLLMLLIIVPVIVLTLLFAWRYRQNNKTAKYEPDWDHSTMLELVIWGAPLLIIIALGLLTWISTHLLDPYRPLQRINESQPVKSEVKPLEVQVVALDWKWLFIYPEQGIATVNELVTPIDVPVRFKITASTVMNSFYIPALAGQIYAMPGMDTTLNAVMNKPGVYEGFSANYSGAGFSHMRFKYHGVSGADFNAWVAKTRAGGGELTRAGYLALEKPTVAEPVKRYGKVAPALYKAVLNRCVAPDAVCMDQMMAADNERMKNSVVKREGAHPGVEPPASGITGNAQSTVPSSDAPASQPTNPMKNHHDRAH